MEIVDEIMTVFCLKRAPGDLAMALERGVNVGCRGQIFYGIIIKEIVLIWSIMIRHDPSKL